MFDTFSSLTVMVINFCNNVIIFILKNYTSLGFKKIRAPTEFFNLIKGFWEKNKHLEKEEDWVSPIFNLPHGKDHHTTLYEIT